MSDTWKGVLVVIGALVVLGSWGGLSQNSSGPTEATPTPVEAVEDLFSDESSGQSNARRQAENYLDSQAFSRKGLIEQLEFEGYSTTDATYAVDNVSVDWHEQAALKAAQYLDSQSFSRSGLLDQLLFEGFTRSQAEYGVSQAY
jgi:Host cell surface-exposed lipoprotein